MPPQSNDASVFLLRTAEDDLRDLLNRVARQSLPAAKQLLNTLSGSFEDIAIKPHIASVPMELGLAQVGYRFVTVEDLLVFYTVEENRVLIHRILPGAKDYKGLFDVTL